MFITKKRLNLEIKVAIQDTLAEIIKKTGTKKPFTYTVIQVSPFEEMRETVYKITATPSNTTNLKENK